MKRYGGTRPDLRLGRLAFACNMGITSDPCFPSDQGKEKRRQGSYTCMRVNTIEFIDLMIYA